MTLILSSIEQQKLIKQSKLTDLISNDYLKDPNNDNLILIADLFFGKDTDRAIQFNVGSNLFSTIADVYSFFIGNPYIDIKLNLLKYSHDLITVGKAVATLNRIDGKLEVEYIPAKYHIFSNSVHKVFRYYEDIQTDGVYYYILKQSFYEGYITNELFYIRSLEDIDGERVPLNTIPQTEQLQDVEYTGIDGLSIFVADDVDALDGKNQSIIEKIKNLVYSLDRKQVMFETQFLQEVDQYKIFENIHIPDSAINSDGTVDIKALGKVLATDTSLGTSGTIKYVRNTNDLIKDAIDYEQKQLKKISSATFIPLDFLGLENQGAISGTSRTIIVSSFIKAIEGKRELLKEKLLKPILDIFVSERQKNEETGEYITTNIFFKDVLPANGLDTANELKIARESGLISQYSAIKAYMGFHTDEEVMKELEKINLDINTYNNDKGNISEGDSNS